MSFAFGFADDDIEAPSVPKVTKTNPLDEVSGVIRPQEYLIEDIIKTLIDVRITFDNYKTPAGNIVYRRELFDVKHQVMSEDTAGTMDSILIGEDQEVDLKQDVYEGGFKSWECSYDAVDHLASTLDVNNPPSVLELGCGTALPSCFLLRLYLENSKTDTAISFALTDYNFEVLRLVTVPNIIIHWASTISPQQLQELCGLEDGPPLPNDEIIITKRLAAAMAVAFAERNISFLFVSGGWNRQFLNLVNKHPTDLVITSETIYSPQSLPLVAELILSLMAPQGTCKHTVVAAKSIYFGVGGSVTEFTNYMDERKPQAMQLHQKEVGESQLKRILIDITIG